MNDSSGSTELFECASCGNIGLGDGEMICCDRSMHPVRDDAEGFDAPTFDELMRVVFDMSETELDVCLCVMEGGGQTVKELAERIEYDRSVVSRHLNHLVDLGVVEKRRRILEEGGQVYVYSPNAPDVVRQNLTERFVRWVREATAVLESLNREKVEAMAETDTRDTQWKIYRE